ncbi:MAG TPA: uracil-DNA glycosylase, partial [Rhodanobacteraceae bacterium]
AQAKGRLIDRGRHHVLQAPHPSPLSAHRGFIGCGHFSAANAWLERHGQVPVDWSLPCRADLAL